MRGGRPGQNNQYKIKNEIRDRPRDIVSYRYGIIDALEKIERKTNECNTAASILLFIDEWKHKLTVANTNQVLPEEKYRYVN